MVGDVLRLGRVGGGSGRLLGLGGARQRVAAWLARTDQGAAALFPAHFARLRGIGGVTGLVLRHQCPGRRPQSIRL